MFAGEALPGIRVDIAPPPAALALPRMDVALFAGFARRGPCHRAIAVSSVAAYEAVFGGDCPLAFDPKAGAALAANLPAAVRAFFSNGGQRCWVIRLAATGELIDRLEECGIAADDLRPAVAGLFPLAGLLRRAPAADGETSLVRPAMLAAASLGSWSDDLRLAARVSRQPIEIKDQASLHWGLRFADRGLLAAGDLIELIGGDGLTTRYAKVLRLEAGEVYAMWIASLLRIDRATPPKPGHVVISGQSGLFEAIFDEGETARVHVVDDAAAALLERGRWAHFYHQGEAIWLRIDSVDGSDAYGPAWQQVGSRLPGPPFSAARVTVDIREYQSTGDRTHAGLGLAPEASASVHSILDADLYHADPKLRDAAIRPAFAVAGSESERIALGYELAGDVQGFDGIAARFGTEAFTAADRVALRSAWLPIGLDATFQEPSGPLPAAADPLVRDGLAVADDRLFLDPRLADGSAATIAERAASILHVEESRLFGIHAGFDIAGDLFPEPSLIAVPDAVQPDWELAPPDDPVVPPDPGAPVQASWLNHSGGCPSEAASEELSGPDTGRFLDCATRLIPAPDLDAPAIVGPDEGFTLTWNEQPAGSTIVLEESPRPDFSPAVELLRDDATVSYAVDGRSEGILYYRLHVEQDGNVSAYASAAVTVRGSRYQSAETDPPSDAWLLRLRRLHAGILRMAGGSGELFAILSLPRTFRTADATRIASDLRTCAPGAGSAGQLGADEERLLSFGALYHPWLVSGTAPDLASASPDGAVVGVMAKRARSRGAWIAPANEPILDMIGLDPSLPEAELLDLDRARVNMVRRIANDFMLHDADTLSNESDWRQINVRRLMILLRRMALRRGMTYVFEPNGPVLRRAIQRDFGQWLDDMQRRGAFAGKDSSKSFRLAVQESETDREAGRLVVEIAVAPAQPMRFLTLRLVQSGSRLTIFEEA